MAKFNTSSVTESPRSCRGATPLRAASSVPDARTHEGGQAFTLVPMTELFLLLSGSFLNEDGSYEKGGDRVVRARELITEITDKDVSDGKSESGEWFLQFTRWLRTKAFIRSGAVVLAAEAVHARLAVRAVGFNRDIVNFACDRADEPGELLGYWLAHYGKTVPISVKRGLADATVRLYSEYSTLKYDTSSHAIRFGDVIEIVNPRTNARATAGLRNDVLFRHLIDRRHAYNTSGVPQSLSMLSARAGLEEVPPADRRALLTESPARLREAGMTWESLAGWLQGPMDARAWESVIPGMGFMASLRNLRNFDEAGIDKKVAAGVAARLADPEQVAKSRQLPFRFWSAYREVANDRWRVALGEALDVATSNIPDSLGGRTLVLADTSGSMRHAVSERSSVCFQEIAALFAVSMAKKFGPENVDLVGFADFSYVFPLRRGASVLGQVAAFNATNSKAGHGTNIIDAVRTRYSGQDRVVLISDMQMMGDYCGRGVGELVPGSVPFYSFNLAGYGTTVLGDSPNRFQLGGLTDATFTYMENVERGLKIGWPWEAGVVSGAG